MTDIKRVEAYAVLLLLSVAVIIFGMFQMEATISASARNVDFSSFEIMLRGIQIASLTLIVSTFMITRNICPLATWCRSLASG